MMLGDNIKTLRKQRGLSQEMLAQQLGVVRQTVSKWEKGLSVPDAELLNRLSELWEVPVSTLLGSQVPETLPDSMTRQDEIAQQLAILNEQLAGQAVRRRQHRRWAVLCLTLALLAAVFLYMGGVLLYRSLTETPPVLTRTAVVCELNGETYRYEIIYDQNFQIREAGGDAWLANHVMTDAYDDANMLLAQIEDYFVDRGGTFRIVSQDTSTAP